MTNLATTTAFWVCAFLFFRRGWWIWQTNNRGNRWTSSNGLHGLQYWLHFYDAIFRPLPERAFILLFPTFHVGSIFICPKLRDKLLGRLFTLTHNRLSTTSSSRLHTIILYVVVTIICRHWIKIWNRIVVRHFGVCYWFFVGKKPTFYTFFICSSLICGVFCYCMLNIQITTLGTWVAKIRIAIYNYCLFLLSLIYHWQLKQSIH